ncbi:MAG: CapA family protein, partial [Tyzzerella sp.]|nr:CapA family protein [Tyzzerella sp.]
MIVTEEIPETIDKIEMPEIVETIEPEIEADTTAEENSTETEKESEVTLIMVGDMLMHTPVNETGVMEDGSIDFSHLFTHTKDMIAGADLAIVNQEVILGGEELGISGYPAFNTYQEFGDDLVDAGFDVVLHATNHALDKGKKGILSCLSYWESAYPEIAVLGIQDMAEEQDEIYVYEENNIRIAVLNYTYGTNGIPLPEDMPYIVNLMDKEQMQEDIAKAKDLADFVVVCPHWGTEYVLEETDYQRNYAEFFLECGVDLVIGTHPHVIEPVEMYTAENGHEMLVYYSLGNYVNCTSSETEEIGRRMLGAMAEVTISMNAEGDAYI